MKKVFAIALLATLTLTTAQSIAQKDTGEETITYLTNRPATAYNEARFTGSPYENEEFAMGNIYTDGKLLAANVAIRYNVLREEIEVKNALSAHNRTARIMSKSPAIYVKILNKRIVYVDNKQDVSKSGYFLILHEGDNYSMYKKLTKSYAEGMESTTSLTPDIAPMYKEKATLYLIDNRDSSLTAFPRSRNGKFGVFKENKKVLKRYANENKLNVNKEYALIKLVKYLDTL